MHYPRPAWSSGGSAPTPSLTPPPGPGGYLPLLVRRRAMPGAPIAGLGHGGGHGGGGHGGGGHWGGHGGRFWGGGGWGGPWWGTDVVVDNPCVPGPIPGTMTCPEPAVRLLPMAGLGDIATGTPAAAGFKSLLCTHIAAKAGASAAAACAGTATLANAITYAAAVWQQAQAGTLPADQAAAWAQWQAVASDPSSPYNIYWQFGALVASSAANLAQAAIAYESNAWADPTASEADYGLMDTTLSGTTWYGGHTVASALTNDQWATILSKAFAVMAKLVVNGVLPITYLHVVCSALLQAPNDRRFPMFTPPGNPSTTDAKAIAFRTCLKQAGWYAVENQWFAYTQQGWAAANAQATAQDEQLSDVITGLDYTSGDVILQQIQDKAQAYWDARARAAQALANWQMLSTGPNASSINPSDAATMSQIQAQFAAIDTTAYNALSPMGLWSGPATPGALNGLGMIQLIIAGVLAVTALGVIAYIVTQMTATARAAADQTAAISKSVLATVDQVKASCDAVYNASAKSAADNATYQDCLMRTQALYNTIPPPPSGSDPLGFKNMAIFAGIALGGVAVLMVIKALTKGRSGSGSAPAAPAA